MKTIVHRRVTADDIRAVLQLRRARESVLGEDLFGEPAWDILLQLYRSELNGDPSHLDDLARTLRMPPSVVARWTTALCEHGLIACSSDALNSAEVTAELSSRGSLLMRQLFEDRSV
jgi:DNA-binding MarR family transcriptional regulator